MSEEKKSVTVDQKELLTKLQNAEAVYTLISEYTKMPYVVCDKETFDDEVLLFFDEETAKKEADSLRQEGNPVQIARVGHDLLLHFYTSFFPMGVNCFRINKGTEEETTIQHGDLVRRQGADQSPKGVKRIENPELHLTSLYFTQEFCKNPTEKLSEELSELYDELRVHFSRGEYIVGAEEDKGLPMLKQKEGRAFLPVFTDIQEFQKFNKEGKFKPGILQADKIPELMTEEIVGVAINPFGVNVILTLNRNMV